MTKLKENIFCAPVYYKENVTSTMDVSRKLAAKGEPHGTVIYTEFQENGRGRGHGRSWQTEKGNSLLFTVLLRYPGIEKIPSALTLRAGLAVAQAIEEFEPLLKDRVIIKWPNDILIRGQENPACKKAAGILCEADGNVVHIGIGVNFLQKEFPPELKNKATSIAHAADNDIKPERRSDLLKIILKHLYNEVKSNDWKQRLEIKLYKKGEQVSFIEGLADSGKEIKGILTGINNNGELLIDNKAYITGELLLNSCNSH